MYVVLTPRHIGGVATEVSAQATATKITDPTAIKCDGKTKYAFKAVKANKTDFSDTGTTRPRNRFLRYNNTLVVLGVTTGTSTSTDVFGYDIDNICKYINTDEGKRYVFTFTSGSSCKAQNVIDNTYWGDNGKQRPAGKANEDDAKTIAFKKGNKTGTIQILVNGEELCSVSSISIYVSFNSSYTSPIDFEVYEIAETKATFNYYQGESKVPYASVTKDVVSKSTIARLAEVPTYLTANYYKIKENQEETAYGTDEAVAGNTYSVRTYYPNDLPFVIDGTTYFSLGSNINTALKAESVPAGDIEFAKYAVKMSGDCINGYLLQDKKDNYLKNTGSKVGYGSDPSKFDIEKSGDNWYLKSRADGQYLIINTDGTVSFTQDQDVNDATPLKNLSKEQAYNYITHCPAGHYVGSYYKDQAGTISFDQIIKGEGKISISADKYYLFEEAEDDTYFLTSKESTKHMSDLSYNYQVSGMAEVTFSSLWQWKNDMIVNANTGKHLDWQARLSDDKNTTSYRSMVDGYNEYKQAYTIELGTNGGQTYYLKQTGKTTIKSINSKPGSEEKTGFWFIREADAFSIRLNAVDGKSYATMYAPVKLVRDAEDKTIIYTGNVNENGNLHLEEWEGGVIPANTPLVLVNEEGAESARFLISYDEPAREVTPDVNWTGTNIKFQFTGDERNNYRLFGFNSTFGVGFFKPKATGNIPANRGYINISDLPYQTIGLQFPDGTTTSIDAAILNGNNTAEDTPIYDISGRRLMQPTRGQFYIRNGQKFIAQ